MLAVTEQEAGANACLQFQTCPDFGSVFRPPAPLHGLLEEPWWRAGCEGFVIGSA